MYRMVRSNRESSMAYSVFMRSSDLNEYGKHPRGYSLFQDLSIKTSPCPLRRTLFSGELSTAVIGSTHCFICSSFSLIFAWRRLFFSRRLFCRRRLSVYPSETRAPCCVRHCRDQFGKEPAHQTI